MEEFKLSIYLPAQIDLLDIVGHLNTMSPEAAVQSYELLTGKLETLAKAPDRCPLVRDTQLKLRGYRTLHIGSYVVFLVISGNTVEIRRVLFSRRQYEWML